MISETSSLNLTVFMKGQKTIMKLNVFNRKKTALEKLTSTYDVKLDASASQLIIMLQTNLSYNAVATTGKFVQTGVTFLRPHRFSETFAQTKINIYTTIYGLKPHLRTKTILNAKCAALANATTLMAIAL